MTGALRVAQAPPDGYTVLLGTVGTQAFNQTLYTRPLYNALTDFAPVALIAEQPLVLVVRNDLPAATLQDFITYARENMGDMSFGSGGYGASTHFSPRNPPTRPSAFGCTTYRIAARRQRCRTSWPVASIICATP